MSSRPPWPHKRNCSKCERLKFLWLYLTGPCTGGQESQEVWSEIMQLFHSHQEENKKW